MPRNCNEEQMDPIGCIHHTDSIQFSERGFLCLSTVVPCRLSAGDRHYAGEFSHKNRYFVYSAHGHQKAIGMALSIGVGVSVGIAMLRVLTGIPILPILIFGYLVSLVITFFVPPLYTGIAFDSGGVASGPMSTTFILPFAIGACEALGGNVLTDAFGIVAMVAMTPLIAIQVLGLYSEIKRKKLLAQARHEMLQLEDDMIYYEEVA